jgi:PBSX family phage terminase large subunit
LLKEKLTDSQIKARKLLNDNKQTLLFGGSRSGKTFIIVRNIIMRALKEPKSRHAIFRQTRKDLKESIWLDTFPKVLETCFQGYKPELNNSDLVAKFHNGSEIWFGFLDEATHSDNVLGKEYNTIYLNEVSEISYASYNKALTRLSLKNGLINKFYGDCNPPGKWHWAYKTFIQKVNAKTGEPLSNPESYAYMLMNPRDNIENLTEDYLAVLENLPEDEKNRFLLGLWTDGISGGIYTKEMALAEQEGRITSIPHNPEHAVFTFWDIGIDDSTAITFAQFIKDKIYIIDYYQNNNEAMTHYLDVLNTKRQQYGYRYGQIFLPHDGKQREWLTGKTRQETMANYGYQVEVVPASSVIEGINTAKERFKDILIDKTKCEELISALSNYHRKEDTKNLVYSKEPVHDWSSHGADTFRLLCVSYREKLNRDLHFKQQQKDYRNSLEYANIYGHKKYNKMMWG